MKRLTLLLLLVSLLAILSSWQLVLPIKAKQNTIGAFIVTPANNALSDTVLSVVIGVNSTFQVSSVKAKVADRETTLAFSTCAYTTLRINCQPGWTGKISLEGLARGENTLTATAVDVFNNSSTTQGKFIYDQFPRLIIGSPLAETVARPNLRVKITCTDDDPVGCNSVLLFTSAIDPAMPIQLVNGSFDGEISLAKLQGTTVDFCVSGRDSTNQVTRTCQKVYDESSSML